MNYATYARALSRKYIRNYEETRRILKTLFDKISQDLSEGKRVRLRGFGSFKRILRPPRKYRNITTGKIETRPAAYDIDFAPSKKLLNNRKKRKIR